MDISHKYEVNLSWKGDRTGVLSSPVLPSKIEVATPPEFPKGIPGIWSPEHLFIAAVGSCLMTTFLAVAENTKLEFHSFSCTATGTLEKEEGKIMITEIILRPEIVIPSSEWEEKTLRVLEVSERNCLISNSVKTRIHLDPIIRVS